MLSKKTKKIWGNMMLVRIISGIIGLAMLVAALAAPNYYIFNAALFVVMVIGLYEFFTAMKVGSKAMKVIGLILTIPFLFFYNSPNIIYLSTRAPSTPN